MATQEFKKNRLLMFGLVVMTFCVVALDPRYEQVVPAIDGRITSHSVPVVGGRVYVEVGFAESSCQATDFGATIGVNGKFKIAGRQELLFARSLSDSLKPWRVCFEVDGHSKELWRQIGVAAPPARLEMGCDLQARRQGTRVSYGICEPRED